jgi:hypothetical protein
MRHALVVSSVLLAALAVLAIACGGSASETPWPIEPPPSVMAPPSELAPTPLVIDDDAGTKPRKP